MLQRGVHIMFIKIQKDPQKTNCLATKTICAQNICMVHTTINCSVLQVGSNFYLFFKYRVKDCSKNGHSFFRTLANCLSVLNNALPAAAHEILHLAAKNDTMNIMLWLPCGCWAVITGPPRWLHHSPVRLPHSLPPRLFSRPLQGPFFSGALGMPCPL